MAAIKQPPRKRPADDPEQSRVAWFCVLERARDEGDKVLEAKALYHLRRLGAQVTLLGDTGSAANRGPTLISLAEQLAEEGLGACVDKGRECGIKRSPWTWIRWCVHGVRGKRLEAVKVGSRWETTVPAIRRFLAATSDGVPVAASTPRAGPGESTAHERYLDSIDLGRKEGRER